MIQEGEGGGGREWCGWRDAGRVLLRCCCGAAAVLLACLLACLLSLQSPRLGLGREYAETHVGLLVLSGQ